MNDKCFFDTNILIYGLASPGSDPREEIRWDLISKSISEEKGVISTQVLEEFYNVSTRKIEKPISSEQARRYIEELLVMELKLVDIDIIRRAISLTEDEPVSFWDSLVITTAERAKCDILFTEDLNHGQTFHGVEVRNPFLD